MATPINGPMTIIMTLHDYDIGEMLTRCSCRGNTGKSFGYRIHIGNDSLGISRDNAVRYTAQDFVTQWTFRELYKCHYFPGLQVMLYEPVFVSVDMNIGRGRKELPSWAPVPGGYVTLDVESFLGV